MSFEFLPLYFTLGVGETNFLKTRREMGNKTEFEARNRKRDVIRDKKWGKMGSETRQKNIIKK